MKFKWIEMTLLTLTITSSLALTGVAFSGEVGGAGATTCPSCEKVEVTAAEPVTSNDSDADKGTQNGAATAGSTESPKK